VALPFLPLDLPAGLLGAIVFVLALALAAWPIVTITKAGSNVPTNLPTTTIVTHNPIYLGMFLGLIGLAIAFDNLWLLMMLVPFALVIRSGDSHLHPLLGANSAKEPRWPAGSPQYARSSIVPALIVLALPCLLGFYANKSPARMGDEPVEEGAAGFELRDGNVLVSLVRLLDRARADHHRGDAGQGIQSRLGTIGVASFLPIRAAQPS
jgi:hypothetical protein